MRRLMLITSIMVCLSAQVLALPPLKLIEATTPFEALLLTATQWVDINGDRRPDLIISGYSQIRNEKVAHVYLNFSSGFVEQASPIRPVVRGTLALADIDGDGDPDLVTAGFAPNEFDVWLYKNVAGHFELENQGWLTPLAYSSLNFGDADRDGDADLLFGSFAGLARNDGGNLVVTDQVFTYYNGGGTSNFCDVNGDGRLDIAQTGIENGPTPNTPKPGRLWLQDTNGQYLETKERLAIMSGPGAQIVPTDLNCDGRQDLFFGEPLRDSGVPPAIAYLQNADGTFRDEGIGANNAGVSFDGGLIDLRGDGTPDVVLTGYLSGTILDPSATQLFEFMNGRYIQSTLGLPRFLQSSIRAVDYDLDGDEDLFIIGEEADPFVPGLTIAGVHLYRNDTAQAPQRCPVGITTPLQPVPIKPWAMLMLILLTLSFGFVFHAAPQSKKHWLKAK